MSALKAIPAAVLLLVVAAALPARGGDLGDARTVLFRMSVNARRTGYEGRKVVINLSRQVPDITRYRVFHQMPGLELKEYADQGRVVLLKDGWLWSYDPQRSLIVKQKAPGGDEWDILQEENLDLVLRNYTVQLEEGKPILGRPSLLVRFDPLDRVGRPSRKVWIDREKGLPLRGEVYGTDGNLYRITHFERIDYQTSFGREVFEIRAPHARTVESDAEVSQCRLWGAPASPIGGDLARPAFVPAGFVAKCLRRTRTARGEQVQQLYTDGLSALSFFQGRGEEMQASPGGRVGEVKVGAAEGRLHEYGLLRLVSWSGGGRHYALVGELSAQELERMARSVAITGPKQ